MSKSPLIELHPIHEIKAVGRALRESFQMVRALTVSLVLPDMTVVAGKDGLQFAQKRQNYKR